MKKHLDNNGVSNELLARQLHSQAASEGYNVSFADLMDYIRIQAEELNVRLSDVEKMDIHDLVQDMNQLFGNEE